jgi:hypothetical protein
MNKKNELKQNKLVNGEQDTRMKQGSSLTWTRQMNWSKIITWTRHKNETRKFTYMNKTTELKQNNFVTVNKTWMKQGSSLTWTRQMN